MLTVSQVNHLHSFIKTHAHAWQVFEDNTPKLGLVSFDYEQDRGGHVLRDEKGNEAVFRMYREKVVAVMLPDAVFVLTEGEAVKMGLPKKS